MPSFQDFVSFNWSLHARVVTTENRYESIGGAAYAWARTWKTLWASLRYEKVWMSTIRLVALWKIFDGFQTYVRSLVWQHLSFLNPLWRRTFYLNETTHRPLYSLCLTWEHRQRYADRQIEIAITTHWRSASILKESSYVGHHYQGFRNRDLMAREMSTLKRCRTQRTDQAAKPHRVKELRFVDVSD